MRIGILSDIHSNLEAFESVINYAESENVDEYICLGDIVGYGANPNRCVEIVRDLTSKIVAGNHDYGVCGKTDIYYFNDVARQALKWTRENISEENLAFLRSLPLKLEDEQSIFVHSTPSSPEDWNYIMNMYDSVKEFKQLEKKLCFIGHSHQPVIFSTTLDNQVSESLDESLIFNKNKKYIVNAGSIGQPRDGNPKASFLLYDTDKDKITYSRIEYDIKKAQDKIIKAGLPPFLAKRLEIGR
jgi:predicted phosphodiesterase